MYIERSDANIRNTDSTYRSNEEDKTKGISLRFIGKKCVKNEARGVRIVSES